MRRFAGGVLGAAALCVLMSAAATASTSTWTVDPGGRPSSSGYVMVAVEETGVEVDCDSVSGIGSAPTGSGITNPITAISSVDVSFAGCEGPFGAVVELNPTGTWTVHAISYDPTTGVTQGQIRDLDIEIVGPGCAARLTGYVDFTYTNATDTVEILPNPTVEISFVDDVDTCFGLIEQGQHLRPSATFVLVPGQDITSP